MDSAADQVIQNVVTLVSTWGLQMAGALAVLIIGRFGCGVARKSVRRAMESRRVDASLIPFVSNLVYFILFAAVVRFGELARPPEACGGSLSFVGSRRAE